KPATPTPSPNTNSTPQPIAKAKGQALPSLAATSRLSRSTGVPPPGDSTEAKNTPLHLGQRIFWPAIFSATRRVARQSGQATSIDMMEQLLDFLKTHWPAQSGAVKDFTFYS